MKGTKTKAWHIAFLMLADVVSVLLAMLIAYLMTVGDKVFPFGSCGGRSEISHVRCYFSGCSACTELCFLRSELSTL